MCRAPTSPPPAMLLPASSSHKSCGGTADPPLKELSPPSPYIRTVWASNLASEIALISDALARHPIAAIDTEFPGVIHRSALHPRLESPAVRYANLKSNVDALNIIQLGLTLSDAAGNLPLIDGAPAAWEFNFMDFDLRGGDPYAPESIALLQKNGIDLDKHRGLGILSLDFAELVMSSGLVLSDDEITWITFHGAYDLGYLIKMLTGGTLLPDTAAEFLDLVRLFLGKRVFDLKHVMQRFDGLYGGLDCVARLLKVTRAAGQSHQAGSDSLHTMMTFLKMKKVFSIGWDDEEQNAGVIFGLDGGPRVKR